MKAMPASTEIWNLYFKNLFHNLNLHLLVLPKINLSLSTIVLKSMDRQGNVWLLKTLPQQRALQ